MFEIKLWNTFGNIVLPMVLMSHRNREQHWLTTKWQHLIYSTTNHLGFNTMTSRTPLNYKKVVIFMPWQFQYPLVTLDYIHISVMFVPWYVLQPWVHHISINPSIKICFGPILISAVQHGKAAFLWKHVVCGLAFTQVNVSPNTV